VHALVAGRDDAAAALRRSAVPGGAHSHQEVAGTYSLVERMHHHRHVGRSVGIHVNTHFVIGVSGFVPWSIQLVAKLSHQFGHLGRHRFVARWERGPQSVLKERTSSWVPDK